MNSSALRLLAGSQWRQSTMAGPGCCVPMSWAGRQADCTRSSISLEEKVIAACRLRRKEWATGDASLWINSAKSNWAPGLGIPNHAPAGRPALMKLTSTPISLKKIRSRDNAAVAAAADVPTRCAGLRWSVDYAARPVRGDPRGRKSGAGPGAANLR